MGQRLTWLAAYWTWSQVSFGERMLSVFGEHEMLRDEVGHTTRVNLGHFNPSDMTLAINSPIQ